MHQDVFQLLGGESVLGPVHTNLDLANATRVGLPAASALALGKLLGNALWSGVAQGVVAIPALRLTPAQSDLAVRQATAIARATAVLGSREKAIHWLQVPNRALGGESPLSLLDTSAGEHEVESLLERIEYGAYS